MPTDNELLRAYETLHDYRAVADHYGTSAAVIRGRVGRARRAAITRLDTPPDMYAPSARDMNDLDKLSAYLGKRRGFLRMMLWSDLHIPDHDARALQLALQIARVMQPDLHVFMGDEFDFDLLSTHWPTAGNRRQRDPFVEAAGYWRTLVDGIGKVTPRAALAMIGGNHTYKRVETFLNENAGLFAERLIEDFIALARCDGRVWWSGWSDSLFIAGLHLEHGVRVGENSARNSLKDLGYGMSRVGGHAHRPSEAWNVVYLPSGITTAARRVVQSVTLPCLCKIHPHYARDKRKSGWVQGIGIATVKLGSASAWIDKVIFHEDGAVLEAAYGAETFGVKGEAVQESAA